MANPILVISDGVDSVNLLEGFNGFGLKEWTPAITSLKGGGVWQNSPMADGRRLVIHHFDNVIETFDLTLNAGNQDAVIEKSQKLRRLLQQARDYWSFDRNDIRPVYIKARAPNETNTRYALIYDWGTPNDANPFTMPFFACGDSSIAEMTLVVERGHWSSEAPLSSACVMISNMQDYEEAGVAIAGPPILEDATVAYGGDNATEPCGPNTGIHIDPADYYQSGYDSNDVCIGLDSAYGDPDDYMDYEFGVRFRSVDIPKNAVIDVAYIKFWGSANSSANTQDARIYAEMVQSPDRYYPATRPPHAWLFDRFNVGPPISTNYVTWTIPRVFSGTDYDTDSLVAIVQEVVNSPWWVQSSNLAFQFHSINIPDSNDNKKYFNGYVSGAAFEWPTLYIEYHLLEEASYGQGETCAERSVFVSNKHNRANITHMFRYEDFSSTFSANLMDGTVPLPFDILNASPQVGDYVAFGIDTSLENSGPFCSLVFDIGTVGSDFNGYWMYYNGVTFVELAVNDNTVDPDTNMPFRLSGVRSVHWEQPSDWTATSINGVTGYWVIFYVNTSTVGTTSPTQQNRLPYSIVTPFVDIDSAQVEGDISALSAIYVQNMSDDLYTDVNLQAGRVIVGLRSKDRGTSFTPYINIGGTQNLTSCVINSLSSDFTLEWLNRSPTGNVRCFTPAAGFALAEVGYIEFQGNELSNYIGVFRAFLRTSLIDGISGDASAMLSMTFGEENPSFYTQEVTIESVAGGAFTLTDMGLFSIKPGTLNYNELYQSGKITLLLANNGTSIMNLAVSEIILMPADEWFCDSKSKTDEALKMLLFHVNQQELRIDAIGNPRLSMRSLLVNNGTDGIAIDTWEMVASSPPILQANKDQRLWFLVHDTDRDVDDTCAFEACHAIRVFKSQRYFSMRGRR